MKRLAFITAALIAALPLSGCISEEQRAENEANLAQAEKNAAAYIYDKYGFEAEMVSSEIEDEADLFSRWYTGYAFIEMEYSGRRFAVYIDGRTENTNGTDDYQCEEITAAVLENFEKRTRTDCDSIFIQNEYIKLTSEHHLLYNTYFDGSNLSEVISEEPFECVISYFGGKTLPLITEYDMADIFGSNTCAVYSYTENLPSDEWYSSDSAVWSTDDFHYTSYVSNYGVYINDSYFYANNNDNIDFRHVTPIIHDAGDFLYSTESGLPMSFEAVVQEDASNWERLKGDNKTVCAGTYELPYGAEDVCVYIPKNSLPDDGEECYIVTSWTEDDGSRTYSNGNSTHNAGEYIFAELEPEKNSFCFTVVHCD